MAVREDENRRVGGDTEKLLTLQEAARRLGRTADDVESLIRMGKLPSFRLAGNLLRIRLGDLETVHPENGHAMAAPPLPKRAVQKPRLLDRIKDFLYFNDFYLVALLILLTLLALILTLY